MESSPPALLILETSGSACSVAVCQGAVLASETIHEPLQHAALLAPLAKKILEEALGSAKRLNGVAVSSGPGSYTGLRIGLAFAKGLCQALEIPLILLPSSAIFRLSLQRQYPQIQEHPVLIAWSSKKDYLYLTAFSSTGENLLPEENYPRATWPEIWRSLQGTAPWLAGSGASAFGTELNIPTERWLPEAVPEAHDALPLAMEAWKKQVFASLHDAEPRYLSGFSPVKSKPLFG